jgi:hypothetical protein
MQNKMKAGGKWNVLQISHTPRAKWSEFKRTIGPARKLDERSDDKNLTILGMQTSEISSYVYWNSRHLHGNPTR